MPYQHLSIHKEITALPRLLLLLLLPLLMAASSVSLHTAPAPTAVGYNAPDFTLSTLQGGRARLS